jgi:hypothetical protein
MIGIGWSVESSIEKDGENDPQLRSRSFERLNVPTAYASAFKLPAALLDDRFGHPSIYSSRASSLPERLFKLSACYVEDIGEVRTKLGTVFSGR